MASSFFKNICNYYIIVVLKTQELVIYHISIVILQICTMIRISSPN